MNFIFFLLPLLCSASLIPNLKDVSKINATSLISSISDANPDDVMQVRDLIDDLIAAGETDRNTATTARNDAQGEADAAGTALQDATDTHTQTAGELVACEEEEARLTLLEDEKRNAKEAADAAKAAASAALAAAQDHLDSETARLDGERETLERILELLDTLLPVITISSTSNAEYSFKAGALEKGNVVWNDRNYVFGDVPPEIQGIALLTGPVRVPQGDIITFSGMQAGVFYALLTKSRDGGYKTNLLGLGWTQSEEETSWVFNGENQFMDILWIKNDGTDLVLPASQTDDAVVVFGWKKEEGGSSLIIADTQLTYTDAFNYCATQGGTIVMPVDKNEIDQLREMIPDSGDVRAWLGIQKDFATNQWVRDDGNDLTYTHWKPGGEGNQNEPDAAMVWQNGWDGHWYDMNPGSRVHYTICRV